MTRALDTEVRGPRADLGGGSEAGGAPPAGTTWSRRHYWTAVGVTGLAALALRVVFILGFTRYDDHKLYDAFVYEVQAVELAHGQFFTVVFGGKGPDASHPPLTAITITPATYFFGLHPGETPQRITMAIVGALTVVAVAMLGRAIAGPRVGIAAGVLAALYPNMWVANGVVMSESLSMFLTALVLLATYRLLRAPTPGNAALAGLACGAVALVRAELVAYVPLIVVPAALVARDVRWRRRAGLAGISLAVAVVTVMPWVGRNLASFEDPTFLSTGGGLVLLGANCPASYTGAGLGGWSLGCVSSVHTSGDQSQVSAHDEHVALTYVSHHLGRLPVVMAARIGRMWDLYQPIQQADDENEGRPANASLAGLAMYYLLLPFAAAGVVVLRLRRITQWPLLVPAGILTVVAATGYGLVRFRAPFEVCLVVLAAAALDALLGARARWRRDHHAETVPAR